MENERVAIHRMSCLLREMSLSEPSFLCHTSSQHRVASKMFDCEGHHLRLTVNNFSTFNSGLRCSATKVINRGWFVPVPERSSQPRWHTRRTWPRPTIALGALVRSIFVPVYPFSQVLADNEWIFAGKKGEKKMGGALGNDFRIILEK